MNDADDFRRGLLVCSVATGLGLRHVPAANAAPIGPAVPILVYHRFGSTVQDSMTVRESTLTGHLKALRDLGCQVIPLRRLVDFRMGRAGPPPPRSVVITADDGHVSQFEIMAPMLADNDFPATFFIYPSAISNAQYAMRWPQLQALALRSQWEFGSHTYWHPNLMRERPHLSPQAYLQALDWQLSHSKTILADRLTRPIDWLSWPFGLEDDMLREHAKAAGYAAAVSLGNRASTGMDSPYALPRYLMTDAMNATSLSSHLQRAFAMNAP